MCDDTMACMIWSFFSYRQAAQTFRHPPPLIAISSLPLRLVPTSSFAVTVKI